MRGFQWNKTESQFRRKVQKVSKCVIDQLWLLCAAVIVSHEIVEIVVLVEALGAELVEVQGADDEVVESAEQTSGEEVHHTLQRHQEIGQLVQLLVHSHSHDAVAVHKYRQHSQTQLKQAAKW